MGNENDAGNLEGCKDARYGATITVAAQRRRCHVHADVKKLDYYDADVRVLVD